jgi:hypothetical protein
MVTFGYFGYFGYPPIVGYIFSKIIENGFRSKFFAVVEIFTEDVTNVTNVTKSNQPQILNQINSSVSGTGSSSPDSRALKMRPK